MNIKIRKDVAILFLLLAIVIGLFFIIKAASDPYLHQWDEQYHALVAKNLSRDFLNPTLYANPVLPYDYKLWTDNHVWLHKQPLSLWILALSIKIFGNTIFAIRLPSVIFFIWSALIVRRISYYFLRDKMYSLFSLYFFVVNGFLIEIYSGRTSTDHVDGIFLLVFLATIYFLIKYIETYGIKYLIFIGLILGLSWLTKTYSSSIALILFMVLDKDKKIGNKVRNLVFIAFLACFVYLPWQFYIHKHFPQEASWESNLSFLHFTQVIENHSGGWLWHLEKAHSIWHELVYLFFIWLCYEYFKNKKDTKLQALLLWIIVPYIVFSFAATKMRAYVIICGPAFFILQSLFINYLFTFEWHRYLKRSILAIILILPLAYGIDRAFKKHKDHDEKILTMKEIKSFETKMIKNKTNVVFGKENYVQLMYHYDGLVAYPYFVGNSVVDSLEKVGYNVIKE